MLTGVAQILTTCAAQKCDNALTNEQIVIAKSRGLDPEVDRLYCSVTCRIAERNRRAKERRREGMQAVCDGSRGSQDAPPSASERKADCADCDRKAVRRCPECRHALCNTHSRLRRDCVPFRRRCSWCRGYFIAEGPSYRGEPQWRLIG
jgi:hypothetical protein